MAKREQHLRVETLPLSAIVPYAGNAKIHTPEQVAQIAESIRQFGNNDPIAIDENNVIIEGHGRLLALQQLGYKEAEVIRLTHLTDEQKRAYILAHNQLTLNTGFDLEALKIELEQIETIDMGEFGFDFDFAGGGSRLTSATTTSSTWTKKWTTSKRSLGPATCGCWANTGCFAAIRPVRPTLRG